MYLNGLPETCQVLQEAMMRKLWTGALVLQALGMLVILALAYADALPTLWYAGSGFDLLGHAALFGTLALLADRALGCRAIRGVRLGPALVLLLAAAEECLQALSPHRTASPWDLAADVAGVVFLRGLVDGTSRLATRRQRLQSSTKKTIHWPLPTDI
jgi:hypothetical protein